MRIVAGEFRGRRLRSPKGSMIRPTTDRVREAIFSIIASYVAGARVLDLFAGTGALGLEALSRGAARAVFVDESEEAIRVIQENIRICGAQERSEVIRGAAERVIRRLAARALPVDGFDLVFMDPPYGKGYLERIVPKLENVVMPEALVICEHHVKEILPSRLGEWQMKRERRYGDTTISILVRNFSS